MCMLNKENYYFSERVWPVTLRQQLIFWTSCLDDVIAGIPHFFGMKGVSYSLIVINYTIIFIAVVY